MAKNVIRAMLGRDLQLTADVIADELFEEVVVFIAHQIIESDTRSDKHLFDARELFDLLDHMHIFAVIDLEIFTGSWRETFSICANAVLELLIAGGITEVCGGASNVVDIALKAVKLGDLFSLCENAFNAS